MLSLCVTAALISEEKLIVKLLISLIQKKYHLNLVVTSVRAALKRVLITQIFPCF